MLEKNITYVDYNGNTRTETHYFNLNKAELIDLYTEIPGGFNNYVKRIIETQDQPKLMAIFRDLIRRSYGVKSDDGRKFMKSKEILDDFVQTEAYAKLYMELARDDKAAIEFINKIIPKDLAEEIKKMPTNSEGNVISLMK